MSSIVARMSRREMICRTTRSAALLAFGTSLSPLFAASEKRRFKIGACDWSIGKMCDPQAFTVAKENGLDGVQVSLGTVANNMSLRTAEVQHKYLEAAKNAGLQDASLAIGELNNVPYKSDPRTVEWVSDS